jgi:nucleotide-binding universal stress UspA family protein
VQADVARALAEMGAPVDHADVEVELVRAPSPAHGLHHLAQRDLADLVVLGSSGRAALGRTGAGSVGERLFQGGPCAVAVAPAGYAGESARALGRVGVAYDGGDESRAAVAEAGALARSLGATLLLIGVADPAAEAEGGNDDLQTALALGARFAPDGVTVEWTLAFGDPATELARQDVDLLICGSRSYGRPGQVLLGATATRLVAVARCPLVVVPRGVRWGLFDGVQNGASAVAEEAR